MATERTMRLEVITPDEKVYEGDIRFLMARATDGDIGIMPGHLPLVAALSTWPVRIEDVEGNSHLMAVFGGFMEVDQTSISIITPNCELPESIDVERARQAKARAEQRLANRGERGIDHVRAEASLRRAMTRLGVTTNNP